MALMERVATLLRANLNELMDRAEDPETMCRQLVLDMENQLLQVKTQVAIALAHQHLLEKKVAEQEATTGEWHRRAELAVAKGEDELARAALERALSHEGVLQAFRTQVTDQAAEAESLRLTYTTLQGKLAETKAECDLVVAKHRRTRLANRPSAYTTSGNNLTSNPRASRAETLDRAKARVEEAETVNVTQNAVAKTVSLESRFAALEQADRVEQMLADLKSKRQQLLPTG